ncbi:MAG: hypothetical protein IPJ95_04425 [Gemmatimonadetes bacterium]|nr:hypothetical protein [Gemmatimonadota bacterium]
MGAARGHPPQQEAARQGIADGEEPAVIDPAGPVEFLARGQRHPAQHGGQGVGAKLVLGPGAQVEEAEAAGHRREADGPQVARQVAFQPDAGGIDLEDRPVGGPQSVAAIHQGRWPPSIPEVRRQGYAACCSRCSAAGARAWARAAAGAWSSRHVRLAGGERRGGA